MLNKESKIRILESFVALDYLFFGKPIHEMKIQKDLMQQYFELKGSLCSSLIEMYSFIKHTPKPIEKVLNESDIKQFAVKTAITARKNVRQLLTCDEGKNNVINTVFESIKLSEGENISVDEVVNFSIQEKAFQLGLDNMLIARALNESDNANELESVTGTLLEDTYKILRNSLIETALEILESQTDDN